MAEVARQHLTGASRVALRELLGSDDLAAVSTWADEVRKERPETFGWHFVDIPWNATGFLQPRDCYRFDEKHPVANNDHHNCVVDRIEIFERVLADKRAAIGQRREALKFLVHFVGDVHQPFHAVGEKRGGNDLHVVVFGSPVCGERPCNLHWVWDEALIVHTQHSEEAYVAYLEQMIVREKLSSRRDESVADWADESFQLAHQVWLPDGGRVDELYFRKNIEIVNERLALAGLRLTRVLNEVLK